VSNSVKAVKKAVLININHKIQLFFTAFWYFGDIFYSFFYSFFVDLQFFYSFLKIQLFKNTAFPVFWTNKIQLLKTKYNF